MLKLQKNSTGDIKMKRNIKSKLTADGQDIVTLGELKVK